MGCLEQHHLCCFRGQLKTPFESPSFYFIPASSQECTGSFRLFFKGPHHQKTVTSNQCCSNMRWSRADTTHVAQQTGAKHLGRNRGAAAVNIRWWEKPGLHMTWNTCEYIIIEKRTGLTTPPCGVPYWSMYCLENAPPTRSVLSV